MPLLARLFSYCAQVGNLPHRVCSPILSDNRTGVCLWRDSGVRYKLRNVSAFFGFWPGNTLLPAATSKPLALAGWHGL